MAKKKPKPDMNAVTPAKAKKILKDGTLHGKPLTDKQRKFFGAIAGRAKKKK